jgi:hypothetical protein
VDWWIGGCTYSTGKRREGRERVCCNLLKCDDHSFKVTYLHETSLGPHLRQDGNGDHPSARHSAIDWSQPDYESHEHFATAETNEVIVHPGDALYLPTNWFHSIISLNINLQCNTRSGRTTQDDYDVRRGCGL